MIEALALFAMLVAGHGAADYPLQGDFLSRAKNRFAALPGVPWYQALAWHSVIHGGMVGVIAYAFTNDTALALSLGTAETVIHAAIDDSKCAGRFGFNADQALHVLCKLIWTAIILAAV